MITVWLGELNTSGAIKWTVRPSVAHSSAMTHIRDNDTSIRLALNTIKTEGVPAVCVALGQATILWDYDSCANSNSKYPPCRGAWQIRQDDDIQNKHSRTVFLRTNLQCGFYL